MTLNLTDVTLVLLGEEVDLNNPAWLLDKSAGTAKGQYALSGWKAENGKLKLDPQKTITWGNLLNGIRSVEWTAAFTDVYGFNPTLVLFRQWSNNLYKGGLKKGSGVPLVPDVIAFQQRMLRFVRPSPGWVETDESGRIRWAFEITPSLEVIALNYLYQFVPFQFLQLVGTLLDAGEELSDANNKALKFYAGHVIDELREMPKTIMVSGPFHGIDINTFEEEALPKWVDDIISQFEETKEMIGPVIVDGEEFQKVTLPSNGVHADLSLGLCSGAEDYYEIQRQFDLEIKKLEVEKLKLEVEKLKILNKSLEKEKPDVLIKNPSEKTSVNLNISSSDMPIEVDLDNKEE